jgi:antirestriction protein ArdC
MKNENKSFDIYEVITEKLLNAIETNNKLTWVKPWDCVSGSCPMNGKTKRPYDGINFFLLQLTPFTSNYWFTYKQIEELGGSVKKSAKATMIVFWKINSYKQTDKQGNEEEKKVPLLRYYNVFNYEQTEGLKIESDIVIPANNFVKNELCEMFVKNYQQNNQSLKIKIGLSSQACYSPAYDQISMPELNQFHSDSEYYSTLFHEMAHSTGHQNRLNRKEVVTTNQFGSCDYGLEELTAELTAAYLCAEIGISNETLERNSIAYLQNWMKAIKADKKMFLIAAGRATKAANFIKHNVEVEEEIA